MSCPTCGHTLHLAARDDSHGKVYWCPRCGTLVIETPRAFRVDVRIEPVGEPVVNTSVPALVERCRAFYEADWGHTYDEFRESWQKSGIAESINPPDRRPK